MYFTLKYNLVKKTLYFYFSIKNIRKEFSEIIVEDDFYILNIFKNEFDLKILSGGKKLDSQFYLENHLQWLDDSNTNLITKLYKKLFFNIKKFQNLDIIYLNAAKLKKDFNILKNKINADIIERRKNIIDYKRCDFYSTTSKKKYKKHGCVHPKKNS